MPSDNLHRLLKRQIKKHNIPDSCINDFSDFFKSINQAFISADEDLAYVENILEVNSKELYKANSLLKAENIEKTKETILIKNKLNRVMDNVTDIMFEIDMNGNFTYLNSAWVKFGEEEPEQSLGKYYKEFANRIKYFDTTKIDDVFDNNFDGFKTVFSRYSSQSELLWWELSIKILRDSDDKILGAIGSLVDVTSLKQTEARLTEANLAKGNFLSTMSHEIRTPLNAVIGITNILLMEDPKESQLENLKTLKFSSKHLLNLINDILDYNKIMTGHLNLDNSPFNLYHTIEGIMNSYAYMAIDKNIELISDIHESVPSDIIGDGTRLSQVLTNLIGNALKFTKEGSVKLMLTLENEKPNSVILRFRVLDTGIGIAPDKLDYIFERFTQADTNTSQVYGGTGLGLAISKKILNLQNSDIYVESKLGIGTEFSFELEVEKAQEKVVLDMSELNSNFDLEGIRILVVDDNDMNLMVITQFFQKWNVNFDEAKDGQQAIDMINSVDYDVVLMDLRMPVMDGYKAVSVIRSQGGKFLDLPIIALSASVSNEVIDKVTKAGMNDYLCKPFNPEDLYKKIRQSVHLSMARTT